jgi:hypothetical protein
MQNNIKTRPIRQIKYLAKDFDSLRSNLLEYARLYYPNKINDFSEPSVGGLFLDMAAYVGDVMSFYMDHQYQELNPITAVETQNIETHLTNAGVQIMGASPATVPVTFYVVIPATVSGNDIIPLESAVPIVLNGTICESKNGITFNLLEDIDFSEKNSDGTFKCNVKVGTRLSDGTPRNFVFSKSGLCISGNFVTETFDVGSEFVPFRRFELTNSNVTEIVSVSDAYGNNYYEVSSLSDDVIYVNSLNMNLNDNDLINDTLKIIPAPYRFLKNCRLQDRKTLLTFGGGSADTLEDDIIPDPSDFAINFPYSRTFSRTTINPQQLIKTKTLGVAATNTTLSVSYRYGGGLSHNVKDQSIDTINILKMEFPKNPEPSIASLVRDSTECVNNEYAKGGDDAPSIDDLRALIPSMNNSQSRIVTKQDLLARVYTLPSNFGRVFRASVKSNRTNSLATQLFIISRDSKNKLIISPDTLKENIQKYLSTYRLISDSIDILDARVINLQLKYEILIDSQLNRNIVLQQVLSRLQDLFSIKNIYIDQPIIIESVKRVISSVSGVISIDKLKFENVTTSLDNRQYSDVTFDIESNTVKGLIIPPTGGIFEIRYPEVDIIGRSI